MEPETKTTETKPKQAHMLSIPGEHRFRMENLAFGIDVWYRRLAAVTFRTEFEPLNRDQGTAMVAFYKTRFNGSHTLTPAHVSILLDLELRLDRLIKSQFPGGAFLRLSDRSPKDADPLDKGAIWKEYLQQLDNVKKTAKETDDVGNLKMIAIGRVNFLRVGNGSEAMSLLLTSERVYSDCLDWLEYGEPVMVALREYDPRVTLENEFRAFIYRNRLTAISQYDHYTFYPELQAKKEHIGKLIEQEWSRVHQLVGEDSYCVDFAYFSETDSVKLIEISPFLPCTGPACFNWKNDQNIMMPPVESKEPFEFRTVLKPRPNMEEVIEANWDGRWLSDSPPYFSTYVALLPEVLAPAASSGMLAGLRNLVLGPKKTQEVAPVTTSEWLATAQAKFVERIQLPPAPEQKQTLFVYGTLKSGFHWNRKFLSKATFVSKARTELPFPLVVGECGVPYLLGDQPGKGVPINGELFRVDDELLAGMDDYEGVTKQYYERREIEVTTTAQEKLRAWVYLLPASDETLRALEPVAEYTQEIHDQRYKPIQHIQVKQQRYLGTLESYLVRS